MSFESFAKCWGSATKHVTMYVLMSVMYVCMYVCPNFGVAYLKIGDSCDLEFFSMGSL